MPNNSNRGHKSRRHSRQIIKSFEAKALKRRSISERLADWLTKFFGSVNFLFLNVLFFLVWIFVNLGFIPRMPIFDPFPFVLMTTLVSLEAIILAVVVLMSQNREGKTATLRDELQLQVELITEKELSKALILLNELLKRKGVKLEDEELDEMLSAIDTSYIEKKLIEQIEGKGNSKNRNLN